MGDAPNLTTEPRAQLDGLAGLVEGLADPFPVPAGEFVVRQGEEGRCLYVVAAGALDVVVTAEGGARLPVARLGPGSHFGEMSLLAGTPVSADVVATEPSVLYALSAEEFGRLLRDDPEVTSALARELALRLKQTNDRLMAQRQRQTALGKLVGAQSSYPFCTQLPSFGKKLTQAVERASGSSAPLLITGEEGTGKRVLAQHIHAHSSRARRPVFVADCGELPPEDAGRLVFGDAPPHAVTRFAEQLGYLQVADEGTLVLAHADRLPAEVQEDLATFLRSHAGPPDGTRVDVRVIVTSSCSSEPATWGLCEALRQALAEDPPLELLPLRNRRRDIVPLAELLLEWSARRSGQSAKALSEAAKRELLAYDFAYGNAAELRQVMQLAVRLAEGDTVGAEHLFFGPTGEWESPPLDLLRWPWLERALVKGTLLGVFKGLVAVVFAALIAVCLVAPTTPWGRLANLTVWGLWWPGLIASMLLLGRVWCAVCPLSTSAEGAKRMGGREWKPPDRLKEIGPPLALIGFVGIVWVEEITHMVEKPERTALLLLALALLAVVFGWLYQRHAWCRYLCPLGAVGAAFSVASALRVQARKAVCGGACSGHECYRGSAEARGCPMFAHALFLTSGQHCKLCMECLRSCPSRSPRLVLQPPLRDIVHSSLIATEMAPVAVVVGLVALLLATTVQTGHASPTGTWWFTGGCLAAVLVGLALTRLLQDRAQMESTRDVAWEARAMYAYAPAAAAVLLAFHLRALPWLADVSLDVVTPAGPALGLTLLSLGQWAAAATGGLMTLWALLALCRQRFPSSAAKAVTAWLGLGGLAVLALTEALRLLG